MASLSLSKTLSTGPPLPRAAGTRAIAGLIRRLLAAGAGVEGVRMFRRIAERGIRHGASAGDDTALAEETLRRTLYQRKASREETGRDEEHYLEGTPPSRHGHPQAPLRAQGPRRTSAPAGAARSPAVIRPGSSAPSSAGRRRKDGARRTDGGDPQIIASGRAGSSPALIRTRRRSRTPRRSLRV
jgi:hypothetical protein